MFGLLTDIVETSINVLEGLVEGEAPTKRQVAQFVDAGVTLYAISEVTGVAVSALEAMLDD